MWTSQLSRTFEKFITKSGKTGQVQEGLWVTFLIGAKSLGILCVPFVPILGNDALSLILWEITFCPRETSFLDEMSPCVPGRR